MDFKVIIRLIEKKSGEVVSYKQDGQRFGQPVTIKLTTDTDYEISFSIRPAITVKALMVNGEAQTLENGGGKDDDNDSKTYIIQYSTTGYDVSKGGSRKDIPFTLEFQDGANLRASLQCKLYKSGEKTHSQWGQKLSAIEIDCKKEKGRSYINVLKERYI